MTRPILEIRDLAKVYEGGFTALHSVSLDIAEGEIFALLGPNGAGKTTLIGTVCGLVQPTGGQVRVGGHDTATDYRAARSLIGLVPQEVNLEPFEKVINTVRFPAGCSASRATRR
jgi:ABC-2 type transport system ATP-binding protein